MASTKLPYTTVEGIWKKAGMLVTEVISVVPAPGFGLHAGQKLRAKSKSGSTPHLVTATMSKRGVQNKCNDNCPQYKSAHICSHNIAAVEINGDLANFLQYLHRSSRHAKFGSNSK